MDVQSVLFALLRTVVCGVPADDQLKAACTPDMLDQVYTLACHHDLAHLVGQAVSKLDLPESDALTKCKQAAMQALMRYMRLNYEYEQVCQTLEQAQIPFIPLKGSVLRHWYPEPWMRTSCDIDVLVKTEDLKAAIGALVEKRQYKYAGPNSHDVSLFAPSGVHVELHFDLVEEGHANLSSTVLQAVWGDVTLREKYGYWYEMSDEFFYFYHIAHMAKHFENGGCGIRPFIDLWILDSIPAADHDRRDALLEKGGLLRFANVARKLSRVWLGGEKADTLSQRMQEFILHGGTYGSTDNRVALQQRKRGGRIGYLFARVFAPYDKLKGYYPILEKHPWLLPVMQVRRWFMLLRPDVARRAKSELAANSKLESAEADEMCEFLREIGISMY